MAISLILNNLGATNLSRPEKSLRQNGNFYATWSVSSDAASWKSVAFDTFGEFWPIRDKGVAQLDEFDVRPFCWTV